MSTLSGCCVCEDPDSVENPILTCKGCEINVHLYCYGIKKRTKHWMCSPCRLGQTDFISCRLCLSKGGAMKQTSCQKWVHVICALFTGGVNFYDLETMEPVDISKVSKTKRNKLCCFCYSGQGYANLCSKDKCPRRLHVTCAQKSKCLKEVVNKIDDKIKFRAYCREHKPKENSCKRLSSESIKGAVTKRLHKTLVKKSAKSNADWIYAKAVSSNVETCDQQGEIHFLLYISK